MFVLRKYIYMFYGEQKNALKIYCPVNKLIYRLGGVWKMIKAFFVAFKILKLFLPFENSEYSTDVYDIVNICVSTVIGQVAGCHTLPLNGSCQYVILLRWLTRCHQKITWLVFSIHRCTYNRYFCTFCYNDIFITF